MGALGLRRVAAARGGIWHEGERGPAGRACDWAGAAETAALGGRREASFMLRLLRLSRARSPAHCKSIRGPGGAQG
eukprot:2151630-Prymnesium_polylepis.1